MEQFSPRFHHQHQSHRYPEPSGEQGHDPPGASALPDHPEREADRPRSLHPVIDPDVCIGSLSCVKSCPEGDILGMVHGAAGSGGLTLLLLPTLPTKAMGVLYLGIFGAGSILGMSLATLLVSIPLGLVGRGGRAAGLVTLLAATSIKQESP